MTPEELDTLMHVLSAQDRRTVLYRLRRDHSLTESALLGAGADQSDQNPAMLYHLHLPKLEETAYIEWDRETGLIRPGPRFEDIEPLLDLIDAQTDDDPSDTS